MAVASTWDGQQMLVPVVNPVPAVFYVNHELITWCGVCIISNVSFCLVNDPEIG